VTELEIYALRLRDHLQDHPEHGFAELWLEQASLLEIETCHYRAHRWAKRRHHRQPRHWHPRAALREILGLSGGGASGSLPLSSPPASGSDGASELVPALS
jgi:hypothetical protein